MGVSVIVFLDTILVPLSFFLMLGYHVYLWQCFRHKPSQITIGIDALRRKAWFMEMKEGDDKKGMLAVQSLRNTQMTTIFTASVTILINLALAALTNNTYKASHQLLSLAIFGSQSGRMYILKFGLPSILLLLSFLCSSMALGFLVDSNFLINSGEFSSAAAHRQIFERGFVLAIIGNRVLCIAFPLLAWMFGPVPVALSSVALVWGLYGHDFPGKSSNGDIPI